MPLTKDQKKEKLKEIKDKLDRQKSIVFVTVDGLKTKDVLDLRKKLKEGDSEISVVKKTLMKIALKEKNISVEEDLEGELALIFGFKDEISPAKIANQFSKENKSFKISGGILENSFIERDKVIALAEIPPKEILYSKVVYTVSAPISGFLNVLQGNMRGLIQVLSSIKK